MAQEGLAQQGAFVVADVQPGGHADVVLRQRTGLDRHAMHQPRLARAIGGADGDRASFGQARRTRQAGADRTLLAPVSTTKRTGWRLISPGT